MQRFLWKPQSRTFHLGRTKLTRTHQEVEAGSTRLALVTTHAVMYIQICLEVASKTMQRKADIEKLFTFENVHEGGKHHEKVVLLEAGFPSRGQDSNAENLQEVRFDINPVDKNCVK